MDIKLRRTSDTLSRYSLLYDAVRGQALLYEAAAHAAGTSSPQQYGDILELLVVAGESMAIDWLEAKDLSIGTMSVQFLDHVYRDQPKPEWLQSEV